MNNVTVHQLGDIRAFFNVDEIKGGLGVSGSSYKKPTFLLYDGQFFNLIQFENEAYSKEWFENESFYENYKVIDLTVYS